MALTSTAGYKASRLVSGSDYDTPIASALASAEQYVKRWTGRALERATYTHTLNGTGTDRLLLPEWPVVSITSVDYVDASGNEADIDASTYTLEAGRGVLHRRANGVAVWGGGLWYDVRWSPVWPDEPQSVKVVYVAGYESGSEPADLIEAVYRLADTHLAQRQVALTDTAVPDGRGVRTLRSPAEEQAAIEALLHPFRRTVYA